MRGTCGQVSDSGGKVEPPRGSTNVAGSWAAGDLTTPMATVARVTAAGSSAAAAITRDLVATQHSLPA